MKEEKYIKISDLRKKLNYIFRTYGTTRGMQEIYKKAIKSIPYAVKGELETTLESNNGWISVKDKLPETSNCVLITDGENVEIGRYDEGVWYAELGRYDEGVWYAESPYCYGEILYWQPLPDISEIYLEIYGKE